MYAYMYDDMRCTQKEILKANIIQCEYRIKKTFFDGFFDNSSSKLTPWETVKGIPCAPAGIKFHIKFHPKKKDGDLYVGVYFVINMPYVNCSVNLVIDAGVTRTSDTFNERYRGGFGSSEFVEYSSLLTRKKKFYNGAITLSIEAVFKDGYKEEEVIQITQTPDWPTRLQNHFQKDFKIFVGEDVIELHRFFLTAESPVIEAMLENEHFVETQNGEMNISDFGVDTVKAAVAFCYGEPIKEFLEQPENAAQLLLFADKYDMKNLQKAFEDAYENKITIDNVAILAEAAQKTNNKNLADKCLEFITTEADPSAFPDLKDALGALVWN